MKQRSPARPYLIGFLAALALTLVAYALVATGAFDRSVTLAVIAALAAVQVIVHLRFFLHLDLSASKREDLQLVLFALLLIGLMVGGTLVVMSDLANRMVP